MAHQFWISYHPPTAKHTSNGDETPPIPEEELEQQKIEHERQMQKEKETLAREAEEVRKLDIELLHQRAIEAEELQKREVAEVVRHLRGMNTSWSHHRLCDLQRQFNRWKQSRPSFPDAALINNYKIITENASSTQLTKPESIRSFSDSEGIFINMTREEPDKDDKTTNWRASENDVSRSEPPPLLRTPSCPGCRAPIASLDCMDDFSANSQLKLDQVIDIQSTRNLPNFPSTNPPAMPAVTPGIKFRNLGKSGLRVPIVGYGMWNLNDEDNIEDVINHALDNGVNLFDLSEAHCAKAEVELGRILKKRNIKRTSYVVTTKIYWSTKNPKYRSDERGLSRKHIIESVKASLTRLQLDYIDVVMIHKADPVCPMEELARAMTYVINQGWVMYWGTARWTPTEIMEAYSNCRQFNCIAPVVEQTEYHMFCREKTELYMPEMYHKLGVGMIGWSAITTGKSLETEDVSALFAKSRFNRKYSTFSWCEEEVPAIGAVPFETQPEIVKEPIIVEEPRTYRDKLRDLSNLADTLHCTLSQLAIAWCLKNNNVNCLLVGGSNLLQFKENLYAIKVVPLLSMKIMAEIEKLLDNKPSRPPMVSTLAMRNQQNNNNTVTIDMTGAEGDVKDGAPNGEEGSSSKSSIRAFCQIQ